VNSEKATSKQKVLCLHTIILWREDTTHPSSFRIGENKNKARFLPGFIFK